MASYNVHGGHNPSGKIACGAKGFLDESKEDRLIAKWLAYYLKKGGAKVYNCTVSNGTGQTDVLKKICAKCNAHGVTMDFSIHLNSGRNDKKGDKKNGGFEIWACNWTSEKKAIANRCIKSMSKLGFTSRGLKTSNSLYYLNHTKAPALLFEICFVDDKDDYLLYNSVGYKKIAKALAEAILNKDISGSTKTIFKAGANVKIITGAEYGGSANGKDVPSAYIGKKYTVTKVQNNNGQKEALIKQLNSWVPTKYLQIV